MCMDIFIKTQIIIYCLMKYIKILFISQIFHELLQKILVKFYTNYDEPTTIHFIKFLQIFQFSEGLINCTLLLQKYEY